MSESGIGDIRLIKSYVFHGDKCFFVSTIDRDSSAPQGGRFSETLTWEFDWANYKRGKLFHETGSCEGSIIEHQLVCDYLFGQGNTEGFDDE